MLKRKLRIFWLAGLVWFLALSSPGFASVPSKINYQGRLVDSGAALSGTHEVGFRIYDSAALGALLWADTTMVTASSDGVFSVVLGGERPITIGGADSCYLEIEVDGEILAPRRELVSVPYALRAAGADSLGDLPVEAFAAAEHSHDDRYAIASELEAPGTINQAGNPMDWTKLKSVPAGLADGVDSVGTGDGSSLDAADGSPTDAVYVDNAGHVGVGTTTPAAELEVVGALKVSSSASTALHVKGTGSTFAKIEGGTGASAGMILRNSAREWSLTNSGGGPDYLSLYDATSLKHRLTIDGLSGKIGFGKTNPLSELHIYKDINDEVSIRIDNPNTGVSSTEALYFTDESGSFAGLEVFDNDHYYSHGMRLFNNRAGGFLSLWTGAADRVHLASDGNLGIGLTDPKAKLEINGLMRVVGTGGFEWPSGGQGIELAYNPAMDRGYLQVYNRTTPGWGELYLGDTKTCIGLGSVDRTGRLNVQTAGTSCIIAKNTGSGCEVDLASSSGYGLTAKSLSQALYAWNTASNCYTYLGGPDYAVMAMGDSTHAYLGYEAWAAYFSDKIYVNGSVYKAGGGFRIDHPLDPENKYLNHSFVESPDMMNIYNGNVVLDGAGEAWVGMPEWFDALNRDFRYQLTCIGQFAPVYVAQKMEGGRFKIAGGTAGLEVSWQVTGIRHDPYAERNRVVVEENKPPAERGKYLRPSDYDKPASAGVDYIAAEPQNQ
ncbi:MAG: PSA repeat domain-containing protein [bacterium]